MAKSMKRKTSNKKSVKKSVKRTGSKRNNNQNKKHKKHKMKKTFKKKSSMRKNIKRVSLKNFSTAHKRYVSRHHHRALHNLSSGLHGGKKNKKQQMCECGCGRNCGNGCGCGRKCGCSCSKNMKGGMISSPASGPVGYAWQGGDEATWPGVAANHGTNTDGNVMSNHFAVSPNGIVVGGIDLARSTSDDPIINPPMNGGRRRHVSRNSRQKGGFFQEIVNLGRGVQDGINGGYFNLIGKQQPISQNPYPTVQPIASTGGNNTIATSGSPPNIEEIYMNANKNVAGL
jgi:hypothetical protein